jgi:hypothetical protein
VVKVAALNAGVSDDQDGRPSGTSKSTLDLVPRRWKDCVKVVLDLSAASRLVRKLELGISNTGARQNNDPPGRSSE